MTAIGFITIGQAPRKDITPDIIKRFPDDVRTEEVGALDQFNSASEVEATIGQVEGEPVFVTRLRDNTSVTVHRDSVIDFLQERISDVEDNVEMIGILCTGYFPAFDADVPILEPSNLLRNWATGITDDGTIGVLMPKKEQISQTQEKWSGYDVVVAAGSPYEDDGQIETAAKEIGTKTDLIIMDCMGYTPAMKRTVQEETEASVLLGRSVLAKTITELL